MFDEHTSCWNWLPTVRAFDYIGESSVELATKRSSNHYCPGCALYFCQVLCDCGAWVVDSHIFWDQFGENCRGNKKFCITWILDLKIFRFKVADRLYIISPYRFTVYAMGMLLGYSLRKHKDFQPSSWQIKAGWTFAALTFISTLFISIRMNFPDYRYNKYEAGLYAAFAPAAWCVLGTWIVFISEKGSSSKFNF